MAIVVSRMKKAEISGARCPPESGRVSLESARRGESNGKGLEASAYLEQSAGREREIPQEEDVRHSQDGSHWNPLGEVN